MNKEQARHLIKDTFEASFDKENFTKFIIQLLNLKIAQIENKHPYSGNLIPDAYEQSISTLERIAKYSDGENEIDILIVKLKKETSLEKARTMQRNFIAWYLNGSRGGEMKDATLAAFVSPDKEDWRFSLVKMDYKFEKTKTGKMKVKEEFTPARRWSFLVGENEKSHTAQSQLVDILKDDEHDPTLEEIEKAFDIETVTKEFFLKYRELFLRTKEELDRVVKNDLKIKDDFESKGVDTVNFAKKLLGQIIFLYFLQKKGWFGVGRDDDWGTGSKHFLRELFEKNHGDYKNFFNDILEPLFYEALRRDRSDDDGYYSRFNCKIPFLNGGLFDPIGSDRGYNWVDTDILLPDKLFSNTNKTKEGDTGTGILDIFDRYNFTVKEDEPLEKEVAIDPELLGKSYEKFNAIRPDNFEEFKKVLKNGRKGEENKFNKKFGVYYTPREIVHYMCQQSLINYLVTEMEGKVSKVAIEFLILNGEKYIEYLKTAKEKKDEGKKSERYKETEHFIELKKHAADIDKFLSNIKVCDPAIGSGAFPVGMMTEIIKARLFFLETKCLSDSYKNLQGDEVRRNVYNYKRDCIQNSLYGVDIDPGAVEIAKLRLWLSLIVDEEDIKQIKPLPNLDYKIVHGNSLLSVDKNLFNNELIIQLEKLKPLYFNETNPRKKHEYKKQIEELISKITNGHKEFDFEVYFSEVFHQKGGFDVVIANPPYGARFSSAEKAILKAKFKHSAMGKFESYRVFIEKGIQLLHTHGVQTYVVPNTWMFVEQALPLRKYILHQFIVENIISFPQETFDVSVDSVAFMIRKSSFEKSHKVKIIDIPLSESLKNIEHYFNKTTLYPQRNWLNSPNLVITYGTNLKEQELVDRLFIQYDKFSDHIITKQGLIPYLTKEQSKENRYISDTKINNKWKPYLDGSRCVGRYVIKEINSFIKYGDWLYAPREQWIFSENRIIFQLIRNISLKRRIVSTYLDYELYSDRNTGLIFPKGNTNLNIKYILAIFNSNLINYIHSKIHNSTYISFPSIGKLPIIEISSKDQQPFINAVDSILNISKDDDYLQNSQKQAKVKILEEEIDQMVYKLYDLTPEEIEIVEGRGCK